MSRACSTTWPKTTPASATRAAAWFCLTITSSTISRPQALKPARSRAPRSSSSRWSVLNTWQTLAWSWVRRTSSWRAAKFRYRESRVSMKQHASLTAIVLVAGILFVSLWFIRRQQPHTIPASPPSSASVVPTRASGSGTPTQSASTPGAAAAAVKTQPAVAPETRVEKVLPEQSVPSTASVRIPVAKVLAKVNGTPITLKDLVAGVGADASVEQILSPAMYQALLERAIERELTFSAARAKAIELTEEQVRQREQVRQSLL